ncbi:MAG: transketolase family protein, partial [Geobacter sp.]|nr:transketolase family protein [Geobacter sp.]
AARETGAFATCEEHSIVGGLGGAVAETLAEKCPTPLTRLGIKDRFGLSGKAEDLHKYFGLMAENVVDAAKEVLLKK